MHYKLETLRKLFNFLVQISLLPQSGLEFNLISNADDIHPCESTSAAVAIAPQTVNHFKISFGKNPHGKRAEPSVELVTEFNNQARNVMRMRSSQKTSIAPWFL